MLSAASLRLPADLLYLWRKYLLPQWGLSVLHVWVPCLTHDEHHEAFYTRCSAWAQHGLSMGSVLVPYACHEETM